MKIIISQNIDAEKSLAEFSIDGHIIGTVEQNRSLPKGFYRGNMRALGEQFSYNEGFEDSVESIKSSIRFLFTHELGMEVEFVLPE